MRRYIVIALVIYLVVAAGIGIGNYTTDPYGGGGKSIAASAGVGLLWPVLVIQFTAKTTMDYYRDVIA